MWESCVTHRLMLDTFSIEGKHSTHTKRMDLTCFSICMLLCTMLRIWGYVWTYSLGACPRWPGKCIMWPFQTDKNPRCPPLTFLAVPAWQHTATFSTLVCSANNKQCYLFIVSVVEVSPYEPGLNTWSNNLWRKEGLFIWPRTSLTVNVSHPKMHVNETRVTIHIETIRQLNATSNLAGRECVFGLFFFW